MGITGRKRRCSCSAPSPCEERLLLLLFLFVAMLLQRAMVESRPLNYTRHRQTSTLRLERISRHLDKINKPPVLTIEVLIILLIYIIIILYFLYTYILGVQMEILSIVFTKENNWL
ncbi:hypothetical protein ACSQ67_024642 [Phaseolus vulgaris]